MRRTSTHYLSWLGLASAGACLMLSSGAGAFTFADGTPTSCVAGGKTVEEVDAEPGQAGVGFTGKTAHTATGYYIIWNQPRLNTLPPVVHDFIFFHECAHARVPTTDELQANCAGLQDMRAAGRAGPAIESKLAAFYGAGNDYWARTLTCANAAVAPPPAQ